MKPLCRADQYRSAKSSILGGTLARPRAREESSRFRSRGSPATRRVFICAYAQILSNRGRDRLTKLSRALTESIMHTAEQREKEREGERERVSRGSPPPRSVPLTDGAGKPPARESIFLRYKFPARICIYETHNCLWPPVCGERAQASAQSPPRAYYIRVCGKGLNPRPSIAPSHRRPRNSDFVTAPSRHEKYARINLRGPGAGTPTLRYVTLHSGTGLLSYRNVIPLVL